MLFWLLLLAGIALSMTALAYLLERTQDRKPAKVSDADWQRVSEEREREKFTRVMGKR